MYIIERKVYAPTVRIAEIITNIYAKLVHVLTVRCAYAIVGTPLLIYVDHDLANCQKHNEYSNHFSAI